MNQRERVVQYVLEHGPCTDESIFLNAARLNPSQMRRYLARGAPEGTAAYEQGSKQEGYTFVLAKLQPEGFTPIKIRARGKTSRRSAPGHYR